MLIYTVLLISTCICVVISFEPFVQMIPNGENVKIKDCPIPWKAVGHISSTKVNSTFPRNAFGKAFYTENNTWTTSLCDADSDKDGISNGKELGFLNCSLAKQWRKDVTSVTLTTPIGHPGICEHNDATPADVNCDEVNKDIEQAVCPPQTTGGTLSKYARIKETLQGMTLSQLFSIWTFLVRQRIIFN